MSAKIITILKAQVLKERWELLQKTFNKVVEEPLDIRPTRSYLLQDVKKPSEWQIVTEWPDMETLQKMRNSGETPAGVRIFKEAEAEPSLTIYEVKEELV